LELPDLSDPRLDPPALWTGSVLAVFKADI